MQGGGANQRNGIARHQNIGIGGFAAAVDHVLINTVIEDQQRSFGRKHTNAQVGILRDALAPNPCRIDHHRGMKGRCFAGQMINDMHAAHRRAVAHQPGDFVGGKNGGTVLAGIQHIRGGQVKCGLTAGSIRRARAGSIISARIPAVAQALTKVA